MVSKREIKDASTTLVDAFLKAYDRLPSFEEVATFAEYIMLVSRGCGYSTAKCRSCALPIRGLQTPKAAKVRFRPLQIDSTDSERCSKRSVTRSAEKEAL